MLSDLPWTPVHMYKMSDMENLCSLSPHSFERNSEKEDYFSVIKSQPSPIKFLFTVTRALTLHPLSIDQYLKGSAVAIRHRAAVRYRQTDEKVPSLLLNS